jgi:hypothetical protein
VSGLACLREATRRLPPSASSTRGAGSTSRLGALLLWVPRRAPIASAGHEMHEVRRAGERRVRGDERSGLVREGCRRVDRAEGSEARAGLEELKPLPQRFGSGNEAQHLPARASFAFVL